MSEIRCMGIGTGGGDALGLNAVIRAAVKSAIRGNPFHYKSIANGQEWVRDISDQVSKAKKLGMDAIITVGGDGSQKIALELFHTGMKIVAVPKTMDNDLCATDVSFGFDAAVTTTDAVDKIHTRQNRTIV